MSFEFLYTGRNPESEGDYAVERSEKRHIVKRDRTGQTANVVHGKVRSVVGVVKPRRHIHVFQFFICRPFYREPYLMHVKWANDRRIGIVWMNRKQTIMVISVCSEPSWECQDVSIDCYRPFDNRTHKLQIFNRQKLKGKIPLVVVVSPSLCDLLVEFSPMDISVKNLVRSPVPESSFAWKHVFREKNRTTRKIVRNGWFSPF